MNRSTAEQIAEMQRKICEYEECFRHLSILFVNPKHFVFLTSSDVANVVIHKTVNLVKEREQLKNT